TSLFSESSREGTKLTRDQVILNVRRAFYTVLLSQQVVDVFRQTLAQTEAHFDNVKKKYEQGVAAEFDLLRSEVDRSEAQAGLIEAQNNLKLAKSALKNAIGLPLDKPLNVSGTLEYQPLPDEEVARMSQEALKLRPEMKQLNLQMEMAQLNASIQKGQYLPSLSLVGNYQFQGQSSDLRFGATERSTSLTAGLSLRFDIFNGFATSARIQQAQAQANEVVHQMENISQLIKLEVEQATLRMQDARQRILTRQKSVAQAQKAYDIAEVRYDNGVGTQLELFDARLALNRTRTNYLQAVYDYNIALFEWQKAVGIIQ
ncbi:MAG: TolC family protein, partial [bacterium]